MKRFGQVEGFVLAGGASTRMGRDKALLEIAGAPSLLRTTRLLASLLSEVTVIGPPARYASLRVRIFPDNWEGVGPLAGIATALGRSRFDWNLIVGCDLPFLTVEWLEWLVSRALISPSDALVPESARGLEPLCALYRARCAPALAAAIERGERKLARVVGTLALEKIPQADWKRFDPDGLLLKNMNSSEDFAEIETRYRRGEIA